MAHCLLFDQMHSMIMGVGGGEDLIACCWPLQVFVIGCKCLKLSIVHCQLSLSGSVLQMWLWVPVLGATCVGCSSAWYGRGEAAAEKCLVPY